MSERKKVSKPNTRDAVETAIDLSKQSKSASWEDLAEGQRIRRWSDPKGENTTPPAPPSCKH